MSAFECLMCARHSSVSFGYINSFCPHCRPLRLSVVNVPIWPQEVNMLKNSPLISSGPGIISRHSGSTAWDPDHYSFCLFVCF